MADRRIPKTSRVIEEIRTALQKRMKIESQEELAEIVLAKLRKEDKHYILSPKRVKQLALTIEGVGVKAKTKKMPKVKKLESCPVCGSKIIPLEGKNLMNKQMLLGYKCVNCAYTCDLESFMPMKYIFLAKGL